MLCVYWDSHVVDYFDLFMLNEIITDSRYQTQLKRTDSGLPRERDCGLSSREIGCRVRRNQTIVIRICNRWTQEGNVCGRSHPHHFTTSHESSVRKASILLGLPLTQNHRRLRRQWCNERMMWAAEWNVCNTTMVKFKSGDTVERGG
ncbi:transposable element Tcb1 transposase [Trichonephila clavipes]|nr:transposable element Tcb1 transposase [Trichonephila clavipes]